MYNPNARTGAHHYTGSTEERDILKKLGWRVEEMWLAVTNETYATLLKCPEFVRATQLGDDVVKNGQVGRIAGLDVYETNNIPDEANVDFVIGNRVFCHFVDEWKVPVAINDLKDAKHIGASAVQGRRVYGKKISRPTTVRVKKHA